MPAYCRLHTLLLLSSFISPLAHAIDLRDYFPTPAGATWLYAFSDWSTAGRCAGRRSVTVDSNATGRLTLVSTVMQSDCTAAAQSTQSTSTETLISGMTGKRLMSRGDPKLAPAAGDEWVPGMLVLPNRAEVFQAFRSSGYVNEAVDNEIRAVSYQSTLKLLAVEKLVVPAGTFAGTVRLQLTEIREYPPPRSTTVELRTDRWLARGVGVLKTKTEVFVNGKVIQSTQLQLACSSLTDVQSVRCAPREPVAE
jgi:hypothetical protein